VAANLGYCGLDRTVSPLRGDEIRPCWETTPGSSPVVGGPASAGDVVTGPPPAWPSEQDFRLFVDLDV
jgi:hypothetical protein